MVSRYLLRTLSIICTLVIKKIGYTTNNQSQYMVVGTCCFEEATSFHFDSQNVVVVCVQKFDQFRTGRCYDFFAGCNGAYKHTRFGFEHLTKPRNSPQPGLLACFSFRTL